MGLHLKISASACILFSSSVINASALAPNYTIDVAGFIDAEHTRSTDNYRSSLFSAYNETGQIIGTSIRYNNTGASLGRSAWLYNGGDTTNIGFTDAEHTAASGYRYSYADTINANGQITGSSQRLNGDGSGYGETAWLYSGGNTTNIGLTDAEHTRSSDSTRYSYTRFLNAAGQVAGYSFRYGSSGTDNGRTAWLYSNGATTNAGLTDGEHTGANGYRYNTVEHLNDAGHVFGHANRYLSNGSDNGQSAWLHSAGNTINIGLVDAEHTGSGGYRYSNAELFNASGQVAGSAFRYRENGVAIGMSSWLYSGGNTTKIGLFDAAHTKTDGHQYNSVRFINDSIQVAGTAQRYDSIGNPTGTSAWLYSNGTTNNIGLADAEHTRSTDGSQITGVDALNQAGYAIGKASRFNNSGNNIGNSVWLYNTVNTMRIGLIDDEHTRSTDGYRYGDFRALNEAGQAIGTAERYDNTGEKAGYSAWLFNGENTINIGLVDAAHTGAIGGRNSSATFLNEFGQVVGYATSYNSAGMLAGQTAWFYDPTAGQTIGIDLSFKSNGVSHSRFDYLGDDGLALGYYQLYDLNDTLLGNRAFAFTMEDGVVDLGIFLENESTSAGWGYLANSYRANAAGQILGYGLLDDMTTGQVGFVLTPQVSAVPLPGAAWLFGAGLAGLIASAKRKTAKSSTLICGS